jgi:hypothetical protein
VDSKTFALHGSLVRMCKNAGRLSYLFTYMYSAICDVSFDDTSSGAIAFNEIGVPECIATSCTVDELDEFVTSFAARLTDINKQSLLGVTKIISPTCTKSDPVGNPTTSTDDNQFITDTNDLYDPPLHPQHSIIRAAWLSEYNAEIEASCTGSCIFDSQDYSFAKAGILQ